MRFTRWLEGAREELAGNRRLAVLAALVPTIIVVYMALVARDAIGTVMDDRSPLMLRAERLAALAQSGDWDSRIQAESARLALFERQIWRADSAQLAAADLQTVLQRSATARLAWSRLKLAPAEDMPAVGGWRVKAELSGKFKDDDALGLLQDLAEHRPRILIDRLELSRQRGQTVVMHLSVLVVPENTP